MKSEQGIMADLIGFSEMILLKY